MTRTKTHMLMGAGLLAALILMTGPRAEARGKNLTWKPVTQAILKLNNHPVKTWEVLQADKNHNLLLVQMNRDWYAINMKKKRLYRVERRDYQTRGRNLVGPAPDGRTPRVKTDGWDSHDVGPAQQISIRFAESGDVLAIELPHPLVVY